MYRKMLGVIALSILSAAPAAAQWSPSRADSHAPIGVMGDHRHEAGEVMLSYRFMRMMMQGSRDGTDAIDNSEIVSPSGYNFMVTPEKMPMNMHMFGVMFALHHGDVDIHPLDRLIGGIIDRV
jgi:hypothetical protein